MKKVRILVAAIMILLLMGQPVFANDVGELKAMVEQLRHDYETKIEFLESKIEQLESNHNQQVQEQVAELTEQIKEDIKEESMNVEYVGRHNADFGHGGVVVDSLMGDAQVAVGGYTDMEYRDLNNSESTFRQHRFVINVAAQVTDRIRFNSEFELEYGGPDAAAGDGEAKVEQAYVDYLINDMINVRGGAILAPFGRYNLYHDSDSVDLTDRPLLARDIIPTTWTEAGFGLFGEFDPVFGSYEDMLVNYEVYAVNGLDAGFSDTGFRGARNSLKTDNNDGKAVVGRAVLSPFLSQEFGVSGYWGEYNGSGDAITGVAFDTFNSLGPVELISEYAYFDVEESPTASSDVANYLQGAYVQLNYHFWPKFLNGTFLGRNFEDPTFTLVSRYGWANIKDDIDAASGDNEEKRYTFGFNYRPIDNFVVKFEYQLNDTDNESLEAGDGDGFITSFALGF